MTGVDRVRDTIERVLDTAENFPEIGEFFRHLSIGISNEETVYSRIVEALTLLDGKVLVDREKFKYRLILMMFVELTIQETGHFALDDTLSIVERVRLIVGNNWQDRAVERYQMDVSFHNKVKYAYFHLTTAEEAEND